MTNPPDDHATTPEEVGSTIDESGIIRPDFDGIIDQIVKEKEIKMNPEEGDAFQALTGVNGYIKDGIVNKREGVAPGASCSVL